MGMVFKQVPWSLQKSLVATLELFQQMNCLHFPFLGIAKDSCPNFIFGSVGGFPVHYIVEVSSQKAWPGLIQRLQARILRN